MSERIPISNIDRYRELVSEMNKLAYEMHPEHMVDGIISTVVKLADAELVWMLAPDLPNDRLLFKTGNINPENNSSALLLTSVEGWVYLNQQPVMINDINQYNQEKGSIFTIPGCEINSILIIPISVRGKSLFILEIANKREGKFSNIDLEILSAYALHAALCLDRAQYLIQTELIPEFVHELRTPLASLNTALQLLQRSDLPVEKRDQISQMIQSEFARLSDLTTSFLDYARLESGKEKFKFSNFDLRNLINETIEIIKMQPENRGMTISIELPIEPLYLTADRDKIKQVILNLLTNAVKYNHPGGMISMQANRNHETIHFSVADDGPGISAESLPHIFERFYRIPTTERQVAGTGLGLPICKHIVEAHHGSIEVNSSEGRGSTFTVILPIEHAA